MKVTQQGKWTKLILILLLILFVVSILFLPLGLAVLTIPEQVFVVSFLVFAILYSKVFGAYYFVNRLLDMIENDEDIMGLLKDNLSKNSLLKFVVEGDLLVLAETQLLKAKEIASLLFDIALVYMLVLFIGNLAGILPDVVFYSAVIAPLIIVVIVWFIDLYMDYKFVRVFVEELQEFEAIVKYLNFEENLEEHTHNHEAQEVKTDEESKEQK